MKTLPAFPSSLQGRVSLRPVARPNGDSLQAARRQLSAIVFGAIDERTMREAAWAVDCGPLCGQLLISELEGLGAVVAARYGTK